MKLYGRIAQGLLLITILVAAAHLFNSGWFASVPDKAWIDTEIRGRGLNGDLLFVLAAALFASVGLPRQVVAFLGGYGFGFISGTGLAMAAVMFACVMSFTYGRLFRVFTQSVRLSGRFKRVADFIHDNTFTSTLLIRLLPAGSNLLVNVTAGVSAVRSLPFFAGSALGYIPQMLIFSLIGSGASIEPGFRIGTGIVLFIVSTLLGMFLYRKYQRLSNLVLEPESGI